MLDIKTRMWPCIPRCCRTTMHILLTRGVSIGWRTQKVNGFMQNGYRSLIFEALTAGIMNVDVFWDVAQCSVVDISRRISGSYWHYYRSNSRVMIEAEKSSETSPIICHTTRCYILEHEDRPRCRWEDNIKAQINTFWREDFKSQEATWSSTW